MTVRPMTRSDRVATLKSQEAVSEELGCLEGVGKAGRGAMTRLEQLGAAALAVVIFIALVMRDCSRGRRERR
jgi:hypothetical protein